MGITRLNVISESALPPVDPGLDTAPQWRWSPDAKLVPASGGRYSVCNFASGKLVTIDERQGRLLARVSGISVPFRIPYGVEPGLVDQLERLKVLLLAQELSGYEEAIRARIARRLQQSHGLLIMPTEKCNFRCKYCYESFEKGRMSEAAADALSAAIRRIAGSADQFALSFFGGEPLLCSDLVLRFSREALEARASRDLPYGAIVTTNGHYLTPALFEQLLEVGVVAFQVTVDGDRRLHDRQRVTVKGEPTFDRIVGNLLSMAASPHRFYCTVRCNARPEDQGRILALFDQDLKVLRGDPRFTISWHGIWASDRQELSAAPHPESSGEEEPPGCAAESVRPLDRFLFERELHERGLRTTAYAGDLGGLSGACYAGKPNWFVVGSDLTLYKCSVVFDREDNRVGKVLPDGKFFVDGEKQQLWTGSNALTDSSCGTCHLRVPCMGMACPLHRISDGHKICPEGKTIERLRVWSGNRPA
jgi:uncharacterized protein